MSIETDNLSKSFEEGKPVLDRLDLHLESGRFTGLLGPSGCGKTTLLRIFAGLERPTTGRVAFGDDVMVDVDSGLFVPPEKRNVSMVFQSYAIWPHMSVFDNAAFPLRIHKASRREIQRRVREVLAAVQLDGLEQRRPNELSGGQQQRVALARALVQRPRVLLLDEPLSNLDASLRSEVRRMIRELQERLGLTAVIVTHDWADARALSDTVIVLREGRVEQQGTVEDLIASPASEFVRSITGAA
jgi:iron(III) transport system ATP-binding protein